MSINLEEGKRYIDRRGSITGPLCPTGNICFPLGDGKTSWRVNGSYDMSHHQVHEFDLIAEYIEEPVADSNKDVLVYTNESEFMKKVSNNKEQFEAMWDMLGKLHRHEITDWTFKMFLDGFMPSVK